MLVRATYVADMKLELDRLNEQLGSLEAQGASLRRESRRHYETELNRLRAHARDARAQWAALDAASEASWQQWMSAMDRTRDAFIRAVHDFKART